MERVVNVDAKTRFYPLKSGPGDTLEAADAIMRRGSFAASRLKNEKNIIRPEEYYIAVKENETSRNLTYWRVPAHELKGFVNDMAAKRPDAYIGIYATVAPRPKGETVRDIAGLFPSSQSVTGVTRQVAHGAYQAMINLHKRGFAHNDLQRDNIVLDEKTGNVALRDTGLLQKYSRRKLEFRQSTQHGGARGYMSPRVAQGELHGKETDYYSFACVLLTTTEPDFERVLSRIYAQEYPGAEKRDGSGNPEKQGARAIPEYHARTRQKQYRDQGGDLQVAR